MSDATGVWIFHGERGRFASGAFDNKDSAVRWIKKHELSGVLTRYPLGQGVYEWSIENEFFIPKKEHEFSADFIQKYTTASLEHHHFENGCAE